MLDWDRRHGARKNTLIFSSPHLIGINTSLSNGMGSLEQKNKEKAGKGIR